MGSNSNEGDPSAEEPQVRRPQPLLACESCRRRKIKCDRELPSCLLCIKSQQICVYPGGPLKPGPKIGAPQRRRKRQSDAAQRMNEENINYPLSRIIYDDVHIPHISGPVNGSRSQILDEEVNPEDQLLKSPKRVQPVVDMLPSPETSTSPSTPSSALRVHSLSLMIHPSNDLISDTAMAMDQESYSPVIEDFGSDNEPILIARACYTLNVSPQTLYRLIDLYFARMHSFSLFHQPTFRAKIRAVTSPKHLIALLAAMLAFSVRFDTQVDGYGEDRDPPNSSGTIPKSESFLELAAKLIDESLQTDERPSLCLLQALTLVTFQRLIQGLDGRAWRSVGTCVRIAYELYLHLLDSESIEPSALLSDVEKSRCLLDEEKRRVWWAIWEIDTFASTTRRCPTAIDWSQIETNLPIDDDLWYRGEFRPSCFLASAPMERLKTLQRCENQAPKAWFIVVNSLMREAQMLSSPRGIVRQSARRPVSKVNAIFAFSTKTCKEVSQNLAVIENVLCCFQLALPASMKYNDEYLHFSKKRERSNYTRRETAIYSIYTMIQLTKFMIYHHGVFGGGRRKDCHPELPGDNTPPNRTAPSRFTLQPDKEALNRYSEASEKIVLIVNDSSEDHVQYVNPFSASIIWLAAAVQLVYKVFSQAGTPKESLTASNFEVLRSNYKQYVDYWKTSTSLQKSLDGLEEQLQRFAFSRTNIQAAGFPGSHNHEAGINSMTMCPNIPGITEYTSSRTSNGWLASNQNPAGQVTNSLRTSQLDDRGLFTSPDIHLGNGIIGTDANFDSIYGPGSDILGDQSFGMDFEMASDLPGYLSELLTGSSYE